MKAIETLLERTRNGEPWALGRFNDGEMAAIVNKSGSISRGAQMVTKTLAIALTEALTHLQVNYWIGLPCCKCWSHWHREAIKRIPGRAVHPYQTLAVVLTNRNHARWQEEFPKAVAGRSITWIGSGAQKVLELPFGESVDNRIVLPAHHAWQYWETLDEGWQDGLGEPPGAVVMTACGPLGRVIAHRWFKARPDLTIIDVGSIYDPITMGQKTARLHQGKLPPCQECH